MASFVSVWVVVAAVAVVIGGIGIWAFCIEPGLLRIRRLDIVIPGWPTEAPHLRVAVLGDIHLGNPHSTKTHLHEVVERINAERPDLILLLGDFVVGGAKWLADPAATPERVAEVLAGLRAPEGVIAVLGNHDWRYDGPRIERALIKAGITVLENQRVVRHKDNVGFVIAGIADDITRKPDVRATLAGVHPNAPTIVLAHDPAVFFDIPAGPIVTFAAHTHGGQVSIPFFGALWIPSRAPRHWAYGLIEDGGRQMYVTSGLGTSMLPVRFNMPPEIAVATLRGAA